MKVDFDRYWQSMKDKGFSKRTIESLWRCRELGKTVDQIIHEKKLQYRSLSIRKKKKYEFTLSPWKIGNILRVHAKYLNRLKKKSGVDDVKKGDDQKNFRID